MGDLLLGTLDLQIVCDAIDDGVIIFDEQDRATFVNVAACRYLGTRASDVVGMTCHTVVSRVLGISPDIATMLFVGEAVHCSGPTNDRHGFEVECVRLSSPHGSTDGEIRETPHAIILRDRTRSKRLREMEDAAAPKSPWRGTQVSLMDPRAILQHLSHEARRANRDGEKLSVVLVKVPVEVATESIGRWISPVLRGSDRVGMLHTAVSVGEDGLEPGEVTMAALARPLHPASHWTLLVLPYTGKTGAHAVALRVRARAPADIARDVSVGVASLEPRRTQWATGEAFDTVEDLLERVCASVLEDERERTGPRVA